jgi:CheY-like chemotaxis protein
MTKDDRSMDPVPHELPKTASNRPQRYILLVAANPDDLYCTSMLLQRFSYPVCTAQSGKQAFDMVSITMPSLVITDLTLPDMSGLDVLRKLGCDARALPVILLLPAQDSHVEERNIEIGGSIPCLAKPVQAEGLYRLVQAAIEPTPRATIRIATRLPVALNKVPLDELRGEYITDLSEDGLYIRTLRPQRRGERVTVQLQIGGRAILAEASVLHVHRPSEGLFREPGMAIRFERMAPGDHEHLRQYIRTRVTQGIEITKDCP